MPIIIHRDALDSKPPSPADDWDKAVGVVGMIAAALFMVQDLFFEGVFLALVNWEPVQKLASQQDIRSAKDVIALLVLHTMMLGLLNLVVSWGVFAKSKWAFVAGPILNAAVLVGSLVWLGDISVEQAAFAVLLGGYCVVRLCGGLGPRP